MAWSPKAADSREAGYIYANRYVSEAPLRLQKRSGPYISRGDVLQHQLLQAQFRHQTLQLRVLLLQFLQPPRLVHLQPAVLFPPTIAGLFSDPAFPARYRGHLAVCNRNFDLPQQTHDLLRCMLLALRHLPLLFVQFLSSELVQKRPGTPTPITYFPYRSLFQYSGLRTRANNNRKHLQSVRFHELGDRDQQFFQRHKYRERDLLTDWQLTPGLMHDILMFSAKL